MSWVPFMFPANWTGTTFYLVILGIYHKQRNKETVPVVMHIKCKFIYDESDNDDDKHTNLCFQNEAALNNDFSWTHIYNVSKHRSDSLPFIFCF